MPGMLEVNKSITVCSICAEKIDYDKDQVYDLEAGRYCMECCRSYLLRIIHKYIEILDDLYYKIQYKYQIQTEDAEEIYQALLNIEEELTNLRRYANNE